MNASWKMCFGLMSALALALSGCQLPGRSVLAPPVTGLGSPVASDSPTNLGSPAALDSPHPTSSPSEGTDEAANRVEWPEAAGKSEGPECATAYFETSPRLSPGELFKQEACDYFPMLVRDAKGLLNWRDAAVLGAALGGAIGIHQDWDEDTRDYVRESPIRWGHATHALGHFGEPQYQIPAILGVYGYSLWTEDEELHSLMKAIISAYSVSGLTTVGIKAIADTERPSRQWNNGHYGFPSFHTSSAFAVAAVVDEYEGFRTALPIYVLGGMIGWSRIDEQDHDLSDVFFGATLGYVIGKTVGRQHRQQDSQMRFMPYSHPLQPAAGLAAEVRF